MTSIPSNSPIQPVVEQKLLQEPVSRDQVIERISDLIESILSDITELVVPEHEYLLINEDHSDSRNVSFSGIGDVVSNPSSFLNPDSIDSICKEAKDRNELDSLIKKYLGDLPVCLLKRAVPGETEVEEEVITYNIVTLNSTNLRTPSDDRYLFTLYSDEEGTGEKKAFHLTKTPRHMAQKKHLATTCQFLRDASFQFCIRNTPVESDFVFFGTSDEPLPPPIGTFKVTAIEEGESKLPDYLIEDMIVSPAAIGVDSLIGTHAYKYPSAKITGVLTLGEHTPFPGEEVKLTLMKIYSKDLDKWSRFNPGEEFSPVARDCFVYGGFDDLPKGPADFLKSVNRDSRINSFHLFTRNEEPLSGTDFIITSSSNQEVEIPLVDEEKPVNLKPISDLFELIRLNSARNLDRTLPSDVKFNLVIGNGENRRVIGSASVRDVIPNCHELEENELRLAIKMIQTDPYIDENNSLDVNGLLSDEFNFMTASTVVLEVSFEGDVSKDTSPCSVFLEVDASEAMKDRVILDDGKEIRELKLKKNKLGRLPKGVLEKLKDLDPLLPFSLIRVS